MIDGRLGHLSRARWLGVAVLVVMTVGCSAPSPTSTSDWQRIAALRDSVTLPPDFSRVGRPHSYGGEGCSWGPACHRYPVSEIRYKGLLHAAFDCQDLVEFLRSRDRRFEFATRRVDVSGCEYVANAQGYKVLVKMDLPHYESRPRVTIAAGDLFHGVEADPYWFCDIDSLRKPGCPKG